MAEVKSLLKLSWSEAELPNRSPSKCKGKGINIYEAYLECRGGFEVGVTLRKVERVSFEV